jgi:hypothetical protein
MSLSLLNITQIQDYCRNKSVAIIGNSDNIIGKYYGPEIDSHDIVVRINYAPRFFRSYKQDSGTKFDVFIAGISRIDLIKSLIGNDSPIVLFLAPWTDPNKIAGFGIDKSYISTKEIYAKVKERFGGSKPSSGSLAINFFSQNIEYRHISLYGFDFFESADNIKRNTFGSFLYKDHSAVLEREYITSILSDKIKLYE